MPMVTTIQENAFLTNRFPLCEEIAIAIAIPLRSGNILHHSPWTYKTVNMDISPDSHPFCIPSRECDFIGVKTPKMFFLVLNASVRLFAHPSQ
jgi:hypothetical protein